MANRTVIVRLGVDASNAVTGLRKVAAEARGTAAKIKSEMGTAASSITNLGPSTRKLGGIFGRAGKDAGEKLGDGITRGADGKLRDAQGKFVNQGKKFGNGFSGAVVGGLGKAALGFAGVAGAAVGLGVGLAKAVGKAATFEASMRQVGKQAGLSGDQLKSMTDLALDMGEKTSFSAQGASDAMLELAKGGLSAAEIRAGALQETLTLASAGGLELGEAAGYMTQGLNTFNLEAGESGRVAAALAGGANASTASVQDLGTALSQVGPGAALLGLSIEDTTAALAAFTNNGMQGSDAGTSLKTMLNGLTPSTEKAAGALTDMGIITEDGTNKFFDATGKLKSMSEVAGLLQKGLEGQTAAQKSATLETIFGSDAYRAAAILAKEGADGVAEYVKSTSDSAAANDLAKSATEGFSGAMERFQGSLETAQIQLGTKFLPILSRALDYLSGPGMDTFKAIGSILGDTFAPQIDAASDGIERFFDYLSTHQAAVIKTFQGWGNGIFDFGVAVAKMAAGGLRSIGNFTVSATGAVLDMVEFIIRAFDDIPFVDMSDSVESFKETRREAETMAAGVQTGLNGMASKIEDDVIPSVEDMRGEFNKSANTEIVKAKQRDAVAKMDQAFKDLSKSVEGNTRTTKDNSTSLDKHTERGKINRDAVLKAITAMNDKAEADFKANVESKGLRKATDIASESLKTNRKKLEEAAAAAGFSKREVRKMIDQYKLTPDELLTKIEAQGDEKAIADSKRVREEYNRHKNKTVKFKIDYEAAAAGKPFRLTKNGPQLSLATGGVLPGYTPGQDVHQFYSPTAGTLNLSGGEGILRPELVRAIGEDKFNKANQAARAGRPQEGVKHLGGFAKGGVIDKRLLYDIGVEGSRDTRGQIKVFSTATAKSFRTAAAKALYKAATEAAAAMGGGGYGVAKPGKYGGTKFSAEQLRNAATIASVAMNRKAALIGLMTAMQESTLRNLGYGDRDSVGLFQQRAPWGPRSARMNPRTSASMFFHGGRGGQPGLDDIPGWQGMDPGRAAQRVQVSAFPGAYAKWQDEANAILSASAKAGTGGSGPVGPPGTGSRARVNWKGGTFTERFRNTLIRAQNFARTPIRVMQGGFSTRVAASGRSHLGDAIDAQWNAAVLSGLRRAGVAAWHRTPAQGFSHHIHGVPLPGYGYAGGSGVWQAQDYKRGGNGLAAGGIVKMAKYDQGGQLQPGVSVVYNGTKKPEHVVTDARWQQLINTRSQPAKIDSTDMARLVEALAHRPAPNLTINHPVAEPTSKSIAKAALYASR